MTHTTTVTSPAGPTAYLQAIKDRQAQACGLKRPTLAALRDCAAALGLDCAIERQSNGAKGYVVSQGRVWCESYDLAGVAALLLQIHAKPWAGKPAAPRSLAPLAADLGRSLGLVPAARKAAAPGRKGGPSCLPEDAASLLRRFELDLDSILTVGASNTKVAKGADQAWPVIHHTLPARSLSAAIYGLGGTTAPRGRLEDVRRLALDNGIGSLAQSHNGCPWASDGCQEGCLVWAGHGGISTNVASCRGRRTLAWIFNPRAYMVALTWAIARQWQQAQLKGLPLSLRLKGTDDLPYHLQRFALSHAEASALARRYGLPVIPGTGTTLPEVLAPALEDGTIRWYEYSKAPVGGSQGLDGLKAAGIDVTASLAADRRGGARAACGTVRAGYRLAVPVALPKGAPIPATMRLAPSLSLPGAPGTPGFGHVAPDDRPVRLRCVDGDLTDLRYLDPQGPYGDCDGVAVILRTKTSKGAGPEAEPFSLQPLTGQWQALKGGGFAKLETVA